MIADAEPTGEHRTRMHRWARRAVYLLLSALSSVALAFAAYRGWLAAGDDSATGPTPIATGITYQRLPLRSPTRSVAHVLRIELRTAGLRMFITPRGPRPDCVRADTASGFLLRHDLSVAVNGAFFHPFFSKAPWDYHPHVGDCVHALGDWMAQGERYGDTWKGASLSFTASLEAMVGPPPADKPPLFIVTGKALLVHDGVVQRSAYRADKRPAARHLFGLDRGGHTLICLLVDGKQPGYSEGLPIAAAAQLAVRLGFEHAIELDGGGSATLVARGASGEPAVLNRPLHTRIPGRQRPVANHIGFWAPPLASAPR